VLERAHLATVMGDDLGLSLRRVGARHVALCPLHDENTPSFWIYPPPRSHGWCFGCGRGLNPIDALMELGGMSYPVAIEHLATRLGICVDVATNGSDSRPRSDARAVALADRERAARRLRVIASQRRRVTRALRQRVGVPDAFWTWLEVLATEEMKLVAAFYDLTHTAHTGSAT